MEHVETVPGASATMIGQKYFQSRSHLGFHTREVSLAIGLALSTALFAQQIADPYSTGVTVFSSKGCPVFVAGIVSGSPAELAGIRPGDQLQAVSGIPQETPAKLPSFYVPINRCPLQPG